MIQGIGGSMGKGDIRTKRGKIARGTFGSKRKRRKKKRGQGNTGDRR